MENIPNEDELRAKLGDDAYHVLREKGTEAPFSGEYYNHKGDGTYDCAVCGQALFVSGTKFDSGTGWPSFDDAIPGSVTMKSDIAHGMQRVEVTCSRCNSHLGHVFPDGPTKTGERYCINSVCLNFKGKL